LLEQLSQLYNGGRVESNPSFSRLIRFQQQADDSAAFWKKAMQGASVVDMGSMLVVQPRARVSESRPNLFSRTSAEMAQPGLLLVEATIEEENKVTERIQYASDAMEQGNPQLLLSHL
ncbi:MAG: hypothetical protein L6R42_001998, partial [Xanthoria sp. 1 TBL-2021]